MAKMFWGVEQLDFSKIDEVHREFTRLELKRSPDYYRARIDMLGINSRAVADAGCGIGQWSVVLAENVKSVTGLDITFQRLAIAKQLAVLNKRRNVNFVQGGAEKMPIGDETVNWVFCYGVIMFTDIENALSEFYRVLTPGGRVYVCGNCLGWSLNLILKRGILGKNTTMVKAGLETILNTRKRSRIGTRYLDPEKFVKSAALQGLRRIADGPEGSVNLTESKTVPPVYPGFFLGYPCVWEWVLEKIR